MPGGDGFEAVGEVPAALLPLIVIVTAFEEYSLRAFEIHAADYLLKPFSDRRFRTALIHVKERLRERVAGDAARLESARRQQDAERFAGSAALARAGERLAIRCHTGTVLLDIGDIEWIEAPGGYVRIHSAQGVHLVREAMGTIERSLPASGFVRVHRSAIVNLARIREISASPGGAATVRLRSGASCRVSHAGRSRLAEALGRRL